MSIEIRDRQVVIDGEPRVVLAGEIHYFRLRRDEWQSRLDHLRSIGGNAVASYVPWLVHERPDGSYDFDGTDREQHDLLGFIDLCHRNGLWFILRPGPFIMAEMKNEGLPYRLYAEHPEIVPVSWDGKPANSRTVDYLAPAFLDECRRWYGALLPAIVPRLHGNGGPVIAVQLDNEVGMLSWVTNQPDLTDHVIADFTRWLRDTHPADPVASGYPPNLDDAQAVAAAIRSPGDDLAAHLARDLGRYMRDRYARYIATLRGMAEAEGVTGVPFLVNVHGTGGGRGVEFPVGISQLYESYTRDPGYLAGTDHYLGDLTRTNFVDLYLINAFMAAVNRPEQPLTGLEFEAGDGDYSGDGSSRTDPSAADFKLRMSVAQGNRVINYYLFSGGINYRLDPPSGDGNDRISFTGERHGNAAPVGPEGRLNSTFSRLQSASRAVMAHADHFATSTEEHDAISFGFNPDDYLTENTYPGAASTVARDADLARHRFGGPGQSLARSLLLTGWRYGAVDIRQAIDLATTPALALGPSRAMDPAVQALLVKYVSAGGTLILNGAVPLEGLDGTPCTDLRDALGLVPTTDRETAWDYYLSVEGAGWAAGIPEYRVDRVQGFDAATEGCFLRAYGTGEGCGFERSVGAGRAIVITTELPGDLSLLRRLLSRHGLEPALRHDDALDGLFTTTTRDDRGRRFLHVLNLDNRAKAVRFEEDGQPLFDGAAVDLDARGAAMLPIG